MAEFLYEFLYRGRSPNDAEAPAYQITVAQVEDPLRQRTLNVKQALAEGFDLSVISQEINMEVLKKFDALNTTLTTVRSQLAEAQDLARQAVGERDEIASRYNQLLDRIQAARTDDLDGDGTADGDTGILAAVKNFFKW